MKKSTIQLSIILINAFEFGDVIIATIQSINNCFRVEYKIHIVKSKIINNIIETHLSIKSIMRA